MKIIKSSQISAFGGLNFVLEEFDKLNIGQLLKTQLPDLHKQSKYSWKDIFYSFFSIFFCGGDCTEDLSINIKQGLKNNPFFNIPSPDRVLSRIKSLSKPKRIIKSPRGKATNEFSYNNNLNSINLKLIKKLPEFKSKDLILDYDNTLIYTNKSDARYTYKKGKGYCPGVGIIGKHVVYVENRNGNSAPHTLQNETFKRISSLLEKEGIRIKTVRVDSASYTFETLLEIRKMCDTFFIKAKMSEAINEAICKIDNWDETELNGKTVSRGSILFTPFKNAARRTKQTDKLEEYRLVVTKEKRNDGQINLFTGEACIYSTILTNDLKLTNDEVVFFYNARGASERIFDELKNDFGWYNLPFSKLEENTVFLIISAICKNLYNHIIETFSKHIEWLKSTFRIKKFIFRFICIPAKWVRSAREYKLRVYSSRSIFI